MDAVDEMINGVDPQVQERRAKTLAEMQRRSNDRIRVYNPTDTDFKVAYDTAGAGGIWTIPARTKDNGFGPGQNVLPRYIAVNYVKHMTDKIIGERGVEALRKVNADRVAKGMRPLDRWEGTPESQDLVLGQYRTDNMDERRKIASILWVGVEEEFAANQPAEVKLENNLDPRGMDEKILDSMNRTAKPLTEFPTLEVLDTKVSVEAPVVTSEAIQNEESISTTSKIDYQTMNIMKLKKLAKEKGLKVGKTTTKKQILEMMGEK